MASPRNDETPLPRCYASGLPGSPKPLDQEIRTDHLVIGGGVTGASTALNLAKSGAEVALIEAGDLGCGGSGRAFGQIVPYGKHSEQWYRKAYGTELGQQVLDWLATGPDVVFALIDAYDINCAARRTGLFFAAHTDGAEAGLRARADYWRGRGADVSVMERDETHERIGSSFYDSALWDRRAGSVNPLGYARGLGLAAATEGANVFAGTPARSIKRAGNVWTVRTPGGTVTAKSVAICTNAYTDDLWPGLRASVVPTRSYQLVSAPVPEDVRTSILPGGQSITDTRRTFSAVRVFDDGRVHLSANGPPFDPTGRPETAGANRRIADLFPDLGDLQWDESWTGWVGVNLQQEPRLSRLDDGMWTAGGYSGRGLAYGTLMGAQLALRMQDASHAEAIFPVRPMGRMFGYQIAPFFVEKVLNHYLRLDERELSQLRAKRSGGSS